MANSLLGAVQREPIVGDVAHRKKGVAAGVAGIASLDLTRLSVAEAAREMRAPVHFALIQVPFRCISRGDMRLILESGQDGTQLAVPIHLLSDKPCL